MKKVLNKFSKILGLFFFGIISFNSLTNLYENRTKIKDLITNKIKVDENLKVYKEEHGDHGPRYLVNPLEMSSRQIPPDNINDLQINDDADIIGQWSAPIDWNVIALHSTLLPDESVMTFGSFGIMKKEKKDIRANKKLTLTDGQGIIYKAIIYKAHKKAVKGEILSKEHIKTDRNFKSYFIRSKCFKKIDFF